MQFIPYSRPEISDNEINEVLDTLKSGWLTTGKKTKLFESMFSKYIGAKHCLAVNSATAGLHLALEALGVQKGDKVITTVHTFTATAEVIRYLGADPIFVDIDAFSFNINCDEVETALISNPDVKVIMPVHFGGQAANMTRIKELAEKYDVKILEDAAHALPTTFNGDLIGNIGDITVFSFYANKTITTGEGGMVVTNNDAYSERIKCMRLHGINRDVFDRFNSLKPTWYYEVIAPGFKYNMTDLAASIGIHQLDKVELFQKRREEIANIYSQSFSNLPVKTPSKSRTEDIHSWHLYVIKLDLDKLLITRDQFIELMSDSGIGTSVHYIPLHLQPYWRDNYNLGEMQFPVSSMVFKRIVSLQNYPGMSDVEVDRVVSSVTKILEDNTIVN